MSISKLLNLRLGVKKLRSFASQKFQRVDKTIRDYVDTVVSDVIPIDIENSTISQVKSRFDDFPEPRENVTMDRYKFFTRRQTKSESIEGFLTDLENKSHDYEFGTLRESLIRDIL
ncbi:unnamed protein product [Arctia plantaginis]|uniref:Uncharacterized protein n=1 Tax=Arctia plantaginis TaxID=874455 RepID=A0A8S1BJR6_ARCPL|nr:unnamed protein product [Arctia plantaginis]